MSNEKCDCQKLEDLQKERDSLLERLLDARKTQREQEQKIARMWKQLDEFNRLVDALLARLAETYGSRIGYPGGETKGYRLQVSSFDPAELMQKYRVRTVRDEEQRSYTVIAEKRKFLETEAEADE